MGCKVAAERRLRAQLRRPEPVARQQRVRLRRRERVVEVLGGLLHSQVGRRNRQVKVNLQAEADKVAP